MGYSVIIPTAGRFELLSKSVASVLAQTERAGQILVIVDSSLEEYARVVAKLLPEGVEVHYTGGARGGAFARLMGLEHANFRIVAFLDDDDQWLPQKMEKQLELIRRNANLVLVSCAYFTSVRGRISLVKRNSGELRSLLHYENLYGGFSNFVINRQGPGAEITIDRRMCSAQDWDFLLAAADQGPLGFVEEPLVIYTMHQGTRISTQLHSKVAGMRRFLYKHSARFCRGARYWHVSRYLLYKMNTSARRVQLKYIVLVSVFLLKSDVKCSWRVKLIVRALLERTFGIRGYEGLRRLYR